MLVRLSSKPSYIEGATSLRSALLRRSLEVAATENDPETLDYPLESAVEQYYMDSAALLLGLITRERAEGPCNEKSRALFFLSCE